MIQGLLLAGGASTRFGSQKLLHPLPDGQPLLRQSALHLLAAMSSVLVVHRPAEPALAEALHGLPVRLLASPRCAEGMGASIAAAVAASSDASGWIITLGDMPWIAPATIVAVRDALLEGASIVVPVHNGERGHPVGFGAVWRERLLQLGGDEGAREILKRHPAAVREVPVTDANIHRDVDVPEDVTAG